MKEINLTQSPPALVWNAEEQQIDIAKVAMLVESSFSVIGATRKDSSLKDKLLENHEDTDSNAVNVTKSLFERSELARIRAIRNQARNYINDYTAPWGKSGERLLPAEMYNEFSQRITELQADWEAEVERIVKNYPIMLDNARERLGDIFRESDYPKHDFVEKLFSFKIAYLPVPTAGDFRVDLIGTASMEAIKGSIQGMVEDKVGEANASILRRMMQVLAHLTEKLADEKAIFRDVTVDKVKEIADLADKLNLTKDAKITEVAKEMRLLAKVSANDLREDSTKRTKTAQKAKELQNSLAGVM